MDNDQLAAIIGSELKHSETDQHEWDTARAQALARFYGKPRGDEALGRSKVISSDVRDMVHAVMADIGPGLIRDDVAEFTPMSEQDEQAASAETAAVADAIFQANDGTVELLTAIQEALLMRATWFKVWIDVDEDTFTETIGGLDAEGVGMALQPDNERTTVELLEQEQTGQRDDEPVFEIKVRRTVRHEALRVECRPVEDCYPQAGWRKTTLEGVRFFADRVRLERSELVDLGVPEDVVRELPKSPAVDSAVSTVRRAHEGVYEQGQEPSTEKVECYWAHIRVDMDDGLQPELYKCLYGGNRVLLREEIAFIPYCSGTAMIRAFRLDGFSLDDNVAMIEDVKTGALRQWLDNLSNTNNARSGVMEDQVNLVDFVRSKPGGYVRIKRPDAIVPLVSQDVGPSARSLLDYADKMRSERGGASLDLQSAEAQIAGHTVGGTERQYSAREKLAQLMALTFAETCIRSLFRLVHRVMRTESLGTVEFKRRGEWQRTDPREWAERSRLETHPGWTVAEKARRGAALQQLMGMQQQIIAAKLSGVLTDPGKFYNAAIEWCQTMGLEAPDRFWIDPASPKAVEAAKRTAQAEAAQVQAQTEAQEALLALTLRFEKYKHDTELRFKYVEAAVDAEVEEAKLVGEATKDLQIEQLRLRRAGSDG